MSFKDRIDFLKNLLDRVDGWLKFAEAKNGFLFTFTLASIAIGFRLTSQYEFNCFGIILYKFAFLIWIVGLIFLLAAYVPKINDIMLDVYKNRVGENNIENADLVFFKDIADMDKSSYIKAMKCELLDEGSEFTELEISFIRQIHINSRITLDKFWVFIPAYVAYLIGLGLALPSFLFFTI
ncbi:hypothetical protein FLM52_13475 [bacterium Scap17]|nr:hypothetical protein [bacterium Scap17]